MNPRMLKLRVKGAVDAAFAGDARTSPNASHARLDARREARERFLAYAAEKQEKVHSPESSPAVERGVFRFRAWAGVAAIAAAATALWIGRGGHVEAPAITFTVGREVTSGRAGIRLGEADAPLPLHFSDGTLVTLSPGAQGRVVSLGTDGAGVLVERGNARMAVVHQSQATRWRVDAGPFEVRVTGTKFDVQWEPESATFRLRLDEGSVVVSGCGMEPTSVRAGESIARTCPTAPDPSHASVASSASAASSAAASVQTPDTPDEPSSGGADDAGVAASLVSGKSAPVDSRPRSASSPVLLPASFDDPAVDASSPSSPSSPATFVDRFRGGDLKEAYALVDARFEDACETEERPGVLTLGELARLLGHEERARHAFARARARFPATRESMMSAFYLGLLDFDRGSFHDAATWFQRCRSEDTQGTMTREASGRALEALVRAHDVAGARTEAAAYLRSYPAGPHANLAKEAAGSTP